MKREKKKLKKTKEELLELKRVRENCKTVIKFKSTFFQILFQGMVENVPGLVVDKIRNNLHTHKYLNINMNFYGIDLSLNVSLEKSGSARK